MGRTMARCLAAFAVLLVLVTGSGCPRGKSGSSLTTLLSIVPITTRFIQVQDTATVPNLAVLINGEPAASTGAAGLAASGTAIAAVISGGTTQIDLMSASTPFTRVQVSIEGLILYFDLTLPAAVTSVSLPITISPTIPIETFTAIFRLGDGAGNWGDAFEVPMKALSIPSGEVQVSVSWNADSDVDLHVIEPPNGMGERVYFGNTLSATGGSLDLDSNPACSIDGVNNESIHWPVGSAPAGTYQVEVDYYSACGVASQYIVTVQRVGHDPLIFTGSFSATDTGVTHVITTFDFP